MDKRYKWKIHTQKDIKMTLKHIKKKILNFTYKKEKCKLKLY